MNDRKDDCKTKKKEGENQINGGYLYLIRGDRKTENFIKIKGENL
jgi:hypothetical protein